jgi:hypothetical protein
MKEYTGSLNLRKKLPKLVKQAYLIFKNQRSRCTNKKLRSYLDYGFKGIKVEYTARQFVQWYLDNIVNFKDKNPCAGRIDHSKNYRFDNLAIISRSENSKEANVRCAHERSQKILIKDRVTNQSLFIAKSQAYAAKITDHSQSSVWRDINNRLVKSNMPFKFQLYRER